MQRAVVSLLLPLFLFSWFLGAARAETVSIAICASALSGYTRFIAEHGNDPKQVEAFPEEGVSRPVADLVIMAKALHLGGLDAEFEFIVVPNVRRELEHVATAVAVISGQQLDQSIPSTCGNAGAFYMSDPICRYGEFQKVFYCLETNKRVLGFTSLEALRTSSKGILGLHWGNDARILKAMGITNFIYSPTFASMTDMVIAGRADWMPLELSKSRDMGFFMHGIRFVPIPGIKFSLLESRHFFVSKHHPQGKRVFDALQKGLAELRKQGFIRKALEGAGFFNPRSDSWTLLNADALEARQPLP